MTEPEGEDGPSYGTLLGRLMKDGERFAKARFRLYRALFYFRLSQARPPLVALAVAVSLATGGFIALAIGSVLALAAITGPLLAGVIVAAIMLAIAALLARYAARAMPDLSALPFEEEDIVNYEQMSVPQQLLTPEERDRLMP